MPYTPEPRIFRGHFGTITNLAFTPDSKWLMSVCLDGTARVWEMATGAMRIIHQNHGITPVFALNEPYHINAGDVSPDGHLAAIGVYGSPVFWNFTTGKSFTKWQREWPRSSNIVAFSPDNRTLLVSDTRGEPVELRDVHTGRLIKTLDIPVFKRPFSPDGRYLLAGKDKRDAWLVDIATGEALRTFTGHTDDLTCAVFSRDGRTVLTGSSDATARLWDASTGKLIHTLIRHHRLVNDVEFSVDGRHIITCSYDNSVRFWSVETGEDIGILTTRKFEIQYARMSPDSNYLVVASQGEIQVWDNPLAEL